jgi:hypothetical protein
MADSPFYVPQNEMVSGPPTMADQLGRPVIVKGPTPTPPQEEYHPITPQERQSLNIPQNVPTVVSGSGKPEVITLPKPSVEHGKIPDGYEIGPDGLAQPIPGLPTTLVAGQGSGPFKVGDSDEINHAFGILDNIAGARTAAKQPLAAGTWASEVANMPVVGGFLGQNRSDLMTKLGAITGDIRQLGIQRLYQMTGQKGVGTMARSNAEQQALQNSMAALGYDPTTLKPTGSQPDSTTLSSGLDQAQNLYERHIARLFNMDPDNPVAIQVVQAAEQNPSNREALINQFKQNGGNIGQVRLITHANGQTIPPIIVPQNASDDDVRKAVAAAGYNVTPGAPILNGQWQTGSPPPSGGSPASPNSPQPKGPPPKSAWDTVNDELGNGITFGLGRPVNALLNSYINGGTYDQNLNAEKAQAQANNQAHPAAGWLGYLASLPAMAGTALEGAGANALGRLGLTNLAKNALKSNLVTVPLGALEGAAYSGDGNRASGAAKGAGVGALVGTFGTPAASLAGRAVGWLGSKLLPELGAWNAFSRIAPEANPQEMAASADAQRAAGQNPAALDTLNGSTLDQVRNVVGGTPGSRAATILNNEAEARSKAAPANVTQSARTAVGAPPVPVEGEVAASPQALRTKLGALRDQQFQETIGPVRGVPLQLPGEVSDMLGDADMRPVIKGALAFTTDPVERQQLTDFGASVAKGVTGNDLPRLSLGAADALRQSLAKSEGPNTPALTATRQALTSFLEHVPQYQDAMSAYRTQSAIASPQAGGNGTVSKFGANKGEAIHLGENLHGMNSEDVQAKIANLPPLDEPITFGTGENAVTITPRQAIGEGVVRGTELKGNNPANIQSLANNIATGEQQRANRVALTPEQSSGLETGIQSEANRVAAANRAAPGSAPPSADEHAVVGAATALAYHSPAMQGAKMSNLMARAKISPDQANRIAQGLVDPNETNNIISNIQRAGYTRARAQQLYQMLAFQLSSASARGATSPGQ